jgi:hypothetical protein
LYHCTILPPNVNPYILRRKGVRLSNSGLPVIQTAVSVISRQRLASFLGHGIEALQRLQQEGLAILPWELEQTLVAAFTNFSPDPRDRALTELVQDLVISRQILEELPTLSIWNDPTLR